MRKLFIYCLATVTIVSCGSGSSTTSPTSKDSAKKETVVDQTKQLWEYSADTDKMTNDSNFYATCTSTNELEFDFPYNGGQKTFITIRKKAKNSSEVLVSVAKGQFMTSVMEEKPMRVKFDDGKPETFYFNGSSSGSNDVVFMSSPKKFISKLLTAKKVMLEAEFYSAGNKVMEFDVAGLKWNH